MPPKNLYKYRTVSMNTKRIFSDREVFFASPRQFNDPFDSRIHYTLDPNDRELQNAVTEMTKRYGRQEAIDMTIGLLDNNLRPEFERRIQDFNEKLFARLGVFCFAESAQDILMWSHYSNAHQGICIEFDTEQFPAKYRDRIYPVTYREEYPTVSIFNTFEGALPLLLTKAPQWSYEREWRALREGSGSVKLPPEAVSSVILGCRISMEDENEVRKWVSERHKKPRILRAFLKSKQFGLDIRPAD